MAEYLIAVSVLPGLEGRQSDLDNKCRELEDFLSNQGVSYDCIASSGEQGLSGFYGTKWYLSNFAEKVLKELKEKYRQKLDFNMYRLEKV